MTINSKEIVFLTAIFILPGLVIDCIIKKINPIKNRSEGIQFLFYLLYSIIDIALFSWLYYLVFDYVENNSLRLFILLIVAAVTSTILGLTMAWIIRNELVNKILNCIKLPAIHSIPDAWDYYFSKQEPSFIIITLFDNSKLYGYYGINSYTSSLLDDGDIYVELGYTYKNKKWELDKSTKGFYVSKKNIKYIEFKKGE